MSQALDVVRTIKALRERVRTIRASGKKIGIVPTMGSLHAGHLSLVHEVAKHADSVIVSVFVNPTQFGEHEDFDAYPRELTSDLEKLSTTPATLVYAPKVSEMYPEGHSTAIEVANLSERFEGEHRPGHFAGVATIVAKLLLQSQADVAIFGEKDFQQLAIIKRMVRDLDIPCDILGGALVRDHDGIALSSRNAYLSAAERQTALSLNQSLKELVQTAKIGDSVKALEEKTSAAILNGGFDSVDYVRIVHPDTLEPLSTISAPARVVATARIRDVRLLDTMVIEL